MQLVPIPKGLTAALVDKGSLVMERLVKVSLMSDKAIRNVLVLVNKDSLDSLARYAKVAFPKHPSRT